MCDEDWVNDAMVDDSLVVDLLLNLHQSHPPPPKITAAPSLLRLDWTVRQRRSRLSTAAAVADDKKSEPTRASPTTPLSWSGATSASGGGGGDEESSRPTKPLKTSRSKVSCNNLNETATTKKTKRKKTLAELKDEEIQLLKERRNLKNELASLRLNVDKHRATNESLKKMKLDLESRQKLKTATTCVASEKPMMFHQPQIMEAQCHLYHSFSSNASSSKAHENENQGASFLLPDLNLPVDEDLSSNSMHGLS